MDGLDKYLSAWWGQFFMRRGTIPIATSLVGICGTLLYARSNAPNPKILLFLPCRDNTHTCYPVPCAKGLQRLSRRACP